MGLFHKQGGELRSHGKMLMIRVYEGAVARERSRLATCERLCTLGEFISANESSLTLEEVRELVVEGSLVVGGGAAPVFTNFLDDI